MKTSKFLIFPIILGTLCFQISPAYSQGRALTEGIEYLFRMGARNLPKIKPSYKIVRNGVALVSTANGVYEIYVDCQRGLASRSITYLPQAQQVNLVMNMCRNYR